MTPAIIIQNAATDGVILALSPSGSIKATGDDTAIARWIPVIREHKVDIIALLNKPANDTATTSWGWLLQYADRDPAEVHCSPVATHAEVLLDFPDAVAAEPIESITPKPTVPMSDDEGRVIRAWLEQIEETDAAVIAETLAKGCTDSEARDYFIERASDFAQQADDRITCRQCANRRSYDGRCQVAAPDGAVLASCSYTPDATMKRRCEGYAPKPNDADQRTGRERWPGLMVKASK